MRSLKKRKYCGAQLMLTVCEQVEQLDFVPSHTPETLVVAFAHSMPVAGCGMWYGKHPSLVQIVPAWRMRVSFRLTRPRVLQSNRQRGSTADLLFGASSIEPLSETLDALSTLNNALAALEALAFSRGA